MPATRLLLFVLAISSGLCIGSSLDAAEARKGYHAKVTVSAPTRLDWIFAVANQSPAQPPASWETTGGMKDYDSTKQEYELFVPPAYTPAKPAAVVLFIAPGDAPGGWKAWQEVCQKNGVIFASPFGGGNNCPTPRRVRIVLDVLDDIRRTYKTDPDRTYLAGFSGGGRIAAAIAFSLPELVGGVVPACATGELRAEPWLRLRAIDRLSVALLTGDGDFNRGEVERFRGPMLTEVGVRTKVWVFPKLGHAQPSGKDLVEVYKWLDEGAAARKKSSDRWPASRMAAQAGLTREEASAALLKEAQERIKTRATEHSGLMQLMGIRTRWPDLPAAQEATKLLVEYDARPEKPWEADDIAMTRKFLAAEARAISAYAIGPLPKEYEGQRSDMAKAALSRWQQLVADGQDAQAIEDAKKQVPELEKILSGK